MKSPKIELPSNRRFGLFFAAVFLTAAAYFKYTDAGRATFFAIAAFLSFLIIAIVCPRLLSPLNRLWANLGLMLGMLISPIVLGMIYFVLFTPLAVLMRFYGRDELRLRFVERSTYWVKREETNQIDHFRNQF